MSGIGIWFLFFFRRTGERLVALITFIWCSRTASTKLIRKAASLMFTRSWWSDVCDSAASIWLALIVTFLLRYPRTRSLTSGMFYSVVQLILVSISSGADIIASLASWGNIGTCGVVDLAAFYVRVGIDAGCGSEPAGHPTLLIRPAITIVGALVLLRQCYGN